MSRNPVVVKMESASSSAASVPQRRRVVVKQEFPLERHAPFATATRAAGATPPPGTSHRASKPRAKKKKTAASSLSSSSGASAIAPWKARKLYLGRNPHLTASGRICSGCEEMFLRAQFSPSQWEKTPDRSRCKDCVARRMVGSGASALSTAPRAVGFTRRPNLAGNARFEWVDLDLPFAHGNLRQVARGVYAEGAHTGEPCVCKWFKRASRDEYEETFFEKDVKATNKAIDIVEKFNAAGVTDRVVRFNDCEVFRFDAGSEDWAGRPVLLEPFIHNYQKFNSNTGHVSDAPDGWSEVMQALSHFSYHVTGGQMVLCDLQGGFDDNGVILTDPVILSRSTTKEYGVTDLGKEGISNFFYYHKCNHYCNELWASPSVTLKYFQKSEGTTMMSSTLSSSTNSIGNAQEVRFVVNLPIGGYQTLAQQLMQRQFAFI